MKHPAKQYTVQLDPEFVEKIDKMAEKLGLSRSQMMRNLMKSGLEDAVTLERFGLFSAFRLGQKVMKKIKEGIASGRIRLTKEGDLKIEE
jgi:predicted DNA-binding protein